MNKLALLLSLMALGALGLVACGGGDDEEEATAASATETTDDRTTGDALAADSKSCGAYERWRLSVVRGISCGEALRVMYGVSYGGNRVPDGWICYGGDQPVECFGEAGERIRAPVRNAVLRRWEATAAASEADPARTSCPVPRYRLAVNQGNISCHGARRVILDLANNRLPGSWSCTGHDADVVCTKEPGASSRIVITARFASEAAAAAVEAGPDRLSNEERIEQNGNKWAAAFAKAGPCRYMGQPACERMACRHNLAGPIRNCTPPSPEFRESFADATVERVVVSEDHRHATAEFSNGESVEFEGQRADGIDKGEGWGNWAYFVTERWIKKIERRNFES